MVAKGGEAAFAHQKVTGVLLKKKNGRRGGGANRSFRGEEFDFGFICGEKNIS